MAGCFHIPELMAPAGDWDCARAAVENGADAVYFGLQNGLNARARATNFRDAELPELMTFLRSHGVCGYLTLNTLVFGDELEEAERIARRAISAGVDAVLVQDLGLLRLLHRLCPELPLHASTQMTLSSAECIRQVESLGVQRVVLPRELSIPEIAAIGRQTSVEIEAFVHGALCVSYSGQCLASLSMGGRSANRGQCAQPCRLPYEVLGAESAMAYPLSPHDLAAFDWLPALIDAGVAALKIEGRLKPPEYVASVVRHYRALLDACPLSPWERARVRAGNGGGCDSPGPHPRPLSQRERGDATVPGAAPEAIAEMEATFSRGFCHGWLDGPNPHALVSGEGSAKRGVLLGRVCGADGERISVALAAPVRRGDGVMFDAERGETAQQGGRVYEIFDRGRSVESAEAGRTVDLAFRYGSIDIAAICRGQQVWKTDDPQVARRLRKTYAGRSARRVALDLAVEAAVGRPLRIVATTATGIVCRLESPQPLPEAQKHPLTAETLTAQFGRLGNTSYELRRLDATLDGRAMLPFSELGKLRHEMVRQLDATAAQPPRRAMLEDSALAAIRAEDTAAPEPPRADVPSAAKHMHFLCRSMDQLEAVLARGATSVIADLREADRWGNAVRTARCAGASILLAAPRIHKPGQSDVFEQLADQRPDGMLVRNLAGLGFCRQMGLPAVADFSLNAANDLTVRWLHAQGAVRVTAAYDLGAERLLALAAVVPPEWLEVVVRRQTPMFHTEYCLYCRLLSRGHDRTDCGRPCQRSRLRLRDRKGVEHPVLSDAQCRNTVFHGQTEDISELIPQLQKCGVRHFRVELPVEGDD
jgi:U32 family peptidase